MIPTCIDLKALSSRGRFLNAREAGEFLGGVAHGTVNRWAREGYLPAHPIGEGKRRLWRFLESDLSGWMSERRRPGVSVR